MVSFKEFLAEKEITKFREGVNESKGRLDISIQAVGKYLTSQKRIEELLYSKVLVEHKTDGVKITALKIDNKGTLDDWIIAYKGNILYSGEFNFAADSSIKKQSIGASQFKFVLEHFNNMADKTSKIPVGTELLVEFLMRKPTLSSDYTRKHGLVLIGYTTSSYKEKNGKLITKPGPFETKKRDYYADLLNLDTPAVLFEGIMGDKGSFERGIKNDKLKEIFKTESAAMNWNNNELLIDDIRRLFLAVESKYGGAEEGVVIRLGGIILKWQQEYQLDKEARRRIKLKYQAENPEIEDQYWKNVRRAALEIASDIQVTKKSNLKDLVKEISNKISEFRIDFTHPKKVKINIQDDIQTTVKQMIIRKLDGNNNALVPGKFRILTKAHYDMIKEGLKNFDGVVVALITSKDTVSTKALRRKMLEKAFGDKIEIIENTSGNLFTLMNKTNENINYIIAGTDRVQAYRAQLIKNPDIKVFEVKRTDEDISASKVIENIEDKKYFKENTPKQIHDMYDEILKAYKRE